MKPKILAILQLPPPIHGVSLINQAIVESKKINERYDMDIIPLDFGNKIDTLGKIGPAKLLRLISIWSKTFYKLITQRYNAIYCSISLTGIAFYRDLLFVILFKLFKRTPIYHLHGKGQAISYKISGTQTSLYKWIFNKAYIIMISPLLYDEVSSFISKEQVFYIPNAIKTSIPDKILINTIEKRKSHNTPVLLFLGNIGKQKGVYILLEALAILNKEGAMFNAKFVGAEFDISSADFMAKCKELNLTDKIEYCGPKYGQDKTNMYLQSDVFVFPTINDAFGIVNIEAMEAGLPVISTTEGAIPKIIDDGITGYLVPKYNINILCEKIKYLIGNPDLRIKMGIEGRKKFLNTYTIDKFEENFNNILKEIIQHAP